MAYDTGLGNTRKLVTFTAGTNSTGTPLGAQAISGIEIPAAMAGTALSVQMSTDDGATWLPVYDDYGAVMSIPIGNTARFISTRRLLPLGLGNVRLVSTTNETASVYIYGQLVAR